jgi:hemerythrin-like metal-binding protein
LKETLMKKQLIEWSDEFLVGILWMDYQHRTLISNINYLHAAILEKKAEHFIQHIISFLESYVTNHFSLEEEYMQACAYPEKKAHFTEHDTFRGNLQELKLGRASLGGLEAESLCYDLLEWFRRHILTTDAKLSAFLKAKNAM